MIARGRERGYLLVWFALMFAVLLGIAGFAFDFGQRFYEEARAQRAADAAALAGVVLRVPGVPGTDEAACDEALRVAATNGFRNPEGVDDGCDQPPGSRVRVVPIADNQLRVTITATAQATFSSLVGGGDAAYVKEATAAYDAGVPMGSPVNVLGNEPVGPLDESWLPSDAQDLGSSSMWLDVHGPRSPTHAGDQYSADDCEPRAPSPDPADNCWTGDPPVAGTTNPYYEDQGRHGQFFVVRVPPGAGTTEIQIFDPTFTDLGSDCRKGRAFGLATVSYLQGLVDGVNLAFLDDPSQLTADEWADFRTRYQLAPSGDPTGGPYCTGDDLLGANLGPGGGDGGPSTASSSAGPFVARPASVPAQLYSGFDGWPITEFSLRHPDGVGGSPVTPGDPTDNTAVPGCSDTFGGFYSQSIGSNFRWNQVDHYPIAPDTPVDLDHPFRETFRQWWTLCQADLGPGDYYVRVRTTHPDKPEFALDDGTPMGRGANRFSLRARGTDGGEGYRIFADRRLTLSANVSSGSQFFLAEIEPAESRRTIAFTFFDPGDLFGCDDVNNPRSCAIAPPTIVGGLTLGRQTGADPDTFEPLGDTCLVWKPGGPGGGPFPQARPADPGPCAIQQLGSGTNGALLRLEMPLPGKDEPGGFDCDPSPTSPFDCWIKVRFEFPSSEYPAPFGLPWADCTRAVGASGSSCTIRPTDTTTWTAQLKGSPARLVGS